MIVKIWLISIILLSVVLGGISYSISKNKSKVVSSSEWENDVNYGFGERFKKILIILILNSCWWI